jgi:hypothetical protein
MKRELRIFITHSVFALLSYILIDDSSLYTYRTDFNVSISWTTHLFYTVKLLDMGQSLWFEKLSSLFLFHHMLSFFLLLSTWSSTFSNVGISVVVFTERSDVFSSLFILELHTKRRKRVLVFLSGCFLVAWCYWRLYLLGDIIYHVDSIGALRLMVAFIWFMSLYWVGKLVKNVVENI